MNFQPSSIFFDHQILIRIVAALIGGARSNFETERVALRTVNKLMTVGHTGLEPGRISSTEERLATFLHQHQFTRDNVNKLVLVFVPMTQCRSCAGRGMRVKLTPYWLSPTASPSACRVHAASTCLNRAGYSPPVLSETFSISIFGMAFPSTKVGEIGGETAAFPIFPFEPAMH